MLAVRAVAVVLTAWVLAILAPPGPASAGGPTSAMLSVPGEGRTASLYYSDDAYEQLARLVDVGGAGSVDESGRSHEAGTGVTVTWLVHDVEPWRVDRIYLAGDDGPWIATQEMLTGTGSIWDAPVVWHQPADGKELTLLLDSLGVGQSGPASATGADGGADEPASAVEPGPAVPASVEPTSTAPTPTDDGSPPPTATVCGGDSEGWQAVCCSPRAGPASAHASRRLTTGTRMRSASTRTRPRSG